MADASNTEVATDSVAQTVNTLNVNNLKSVGELVSLAAGQAAMELVNHHKAMNHIRENMFQTWVTRTDEVGPEQATALGKALSADLSDKLSNLGSALAGIQAFIQALGKGPEAAKP